MIKKMSSLIFFVVLSVVCLDKTFALETKTHKDINGYITNMTFPNGFNLNTYLKDNLGLSGIGEVLTENKKVEDWIKLGGEYEDIPAWSEMYLRSKNHFHNPRYTWDTAGLTDVFTGKSAILWALSPIGTQSYGYYSWYDTRDYYLKALISTDKNTRNTYFAGTFRGLGQLMHLVQDMSVPEHARNDGHFLPWGDYEHWVKNTNISNYSPIFFGGVITNISSFFDTNQYNGSNPSVAVGNMIGLSEYSNANFLSPDTIFTEDLPSGDKHYQPYPRKDSVIDPVSGQQPPEDITAEDGNVDRVFYVKKTKDGEIVNHLAQASYLAKDLYIKLWPLEIGLYYRLSFQLDDTVYKDYALHFPRNSGHTERLGYNTILKP